MYIILGHKVDYLIPISSILENDAGGWLLFIIAKILQKQQ